MFLSDEGPTLETLDFAFYIGSTPMSWQYTNLFTFCVEIYIAYIGNLAAADVSYKNPEFKR